MLMMPKVNRKLMIFLAQKHREKWEGRGERTGHAWWSSLEFQDSEG